MEAPRSFLWGGPYHRAALPGTDPPGDPLLMSGHEYRPVRMVIVDGEPMRMFRHDPECCDSARGEVVEDEEPPPA